MNYCFLSFFLCWFGASVVFASDPKNPHIQGIQKFLDKIVSWQQQQQQQQNEAKRSSARPTTRPFVTLSFAQSLDAKIALYTNDDDDKTRTTTSNYPLSGPESLLLTHGLRSIHDAILVGGRTLSIDNPRLSNRLWHSQQQQQSQQPRPIVLDSKLSHVETLLLLNNNNNTTLNAKNLIICCEKSESVQQRLQNLQGQHQLSNNINNVTILQCEVNHKGKISLDKLLERLFLDFGIRSIMIEGGSQVISSFVTEDLVDCICITIAPTILGDRGLSSLSSFGPPPQLPVLPIHHHHYGETDVLLLGKDCVLLARSSYSSRTKEF